EGAQLAGVKLNLWTNPYLAEGCTLYRSLQGDFGSHLVWMGAVPDILLPDAAAKVQERLLSIGACEGVSGFKVDEVDGTDNWLWPDHARFPSGLSGDAMRSVYGVLWQKLIHEVYRKRNQRTFGLVRGSNGCATRFPFAIYSDSYNHEEYIAACSSAGLAGVLWCGEARDAATAEEWVCRVQAAMLSHVAQLNGWSEHCLPWTYPEVESYVRQAIEFRRAIVPYLYTAYAQYCFDGFPVCRAMCLVDGGDETDQYLLGSDLLVAPSTFGRASRSVRLPAGEWFHYETGARAGSNGTIEIAANPAAMPVFVRSGVLIPTVDPSTPPGSSGRLIVKRYGATPAVGLLYDDDGVSFDYEKGACGWYALSWTEGAAGELNRLAGGRSFTYPEVLWQRVGPGG
ncbi:MAG TPA: TIM-barrel domain-containing protein, partial [Chthonomonadales bacterium]|nr:TIM-barrel domain-containing protein [Chthonomonadales bacterium]